MTEAARPDFCAVCAASLAKNNRSGYCSKRECRRELDAKQKRESYIPKRTYRCIDCPKPLRSDNRSGRCKSCLHRYTYRKGRILCRTPGCINLCNRTKHGCCRKCARTQVYYKPRQNFRFCDLCSALLNGSNKWGICLECGRRGEGRRIIGKRRTAYPRIDFILP